MLAGLRPCTTRGEECGVSPPHGEVPSLCSGQALLFRQKDQTMGPGRGPRGCLCPGPERFGLRNSLRSNSPRPHIDSGPGRSRARRRLEVARVRKQRTANAPSPYPLPVGEGKKRQRHWIPDQVGNDRKREDRYPDRRSPV